MNGKLRRQLKAEITYDSAIGVLLIETEGQIEEESVHGIKYFLTNVEAHMRFVATN